MISVKSFTRSNFWIKLKSWEYWPFGIVQFPAIIYWIWLSIRARSFVFFSASNPGIPMGGMFGESKYDILQKISPRYVPRTLLINMNLSADEVIEMMRAANISFPLIFKPDVGERGFMVRRIDDAADVARYLQETRGSFLAQELVSEPLEFGVFYMRLPHEREGRLISVAAKEMLSVVGNGTATLRELILEHDRAKLQWPKLKNSFHHQLECVVPANRRVELVAIGNHALGTRFINANHLINDRLSQTFEKISNAIPGFYFGRYDLRCRSLEDLYNGNIRIMELNGCGAEPAHIYDARVSIWQGFTTLVTHWRYIFAISRSNRERGVKYVSHREAFAYYRKFRSAVK